MKRYKLTIAYEGTAYNGWQRQPDPAVTVQREVERAAGSIVSHPVTVQGVSRTDAGVHAVGQVAAMNATISLDDERLRRAINSRLPPDIFIRELKETSPNFDVRTAKRKRYRYMIWAAQDRPLFQRKFVYHYYKKLDFAPMQAACADFIGTHDFEGFRGQSELRENTVRTIYSCAIHRRVEGDPLLVFAVEGSGFLYHMVRTMVGTILQIGTGRLAADCIPKVFASRKRDDAGVCAPAQGLCLQWVRFHDSRVKTSMETEAPVCAESYGMNFEQGRMKIVHVITRLIVGGAQENTLLTCEGLKRRGHDVTLVTGPSEGPEGSLLERAKSGGYKVIVTPQLVRSPHVWRDLRGYRFLKKLCRETKPQIVHTHSSKAGIIGRGAAFATRRRTPAPRPIIVHTIHGLPFHPYQHGLVNRLWIEAERWAAHHCDAIISVADAMTRQALAAKVGCRDMYTTIYSAMEIETFINPGVTREEVRQRLGIPQNAFVFGTIARLQPLKGHDDLLNTASGLFAKVPDAHLLWVGDGVFRPRLEEMIRQQGWTKRITLTGLVPPSEVPKLLPAMDVVVHPSYREGLARALPQALLAGKPVISYDCDGAGEVCLEGRTGFLVKTGQVHELYEAMRRMAGDRGAAVRMGMEGRAFCSERFSAERMVDQIESLYRKLLPGDVKP